jgi:sec-independent protein translocase protein TatA
MFGISFEHILIVGVILLLVGPRRLPELGNTMGKAIKNFKDSFSGIEEANFKRLNPEPAVPNPVAQAAAPVVTPVAETAVNPSHENNA